MYISKYIGRLSIALLLGLSFSIGTPPVNAQESVQNTSTRLIFVGHIRGPRNFEINHLLPYFAEEVAALNPSAVLIGGDSISGYITAYDESSLEREWELVDHELRRIDAPIFRVVGNHDWHSDTTATVFKRRYGPDYFSRQINAVSILGINAIPQMSDTSINWGEIWSSDAILPNEPSPLPEPQLKFILDELSRIRSDASVNHVVLLMGAALWKLENTREQWRYHIEPVLKSLPQSVLVLSGEIDRENYKMSTIDGVSYIVGGIGILEPDQPASLRHGAYLNILFTQANTHPQINVELINLTPQTYRAIVDASMPDLEKHLLVDQRLSLGDPVNAVNQLRHRIKQILINRLDIYNRQNNIVLLILLALFIGIPILLVTIRCFKK
jgi:hypothetical protein